MLKAEDRNRRSSRVKVRDKECSTREQVAVKILKEIVKNQFLSYKCFTDSGTISIVFGILTGFIFSDGSYIEG